MTKFNQLYNLIMEELEKPVLILKFEVYSTNILTIKELWKKGNNFYKVVKKCKPSIEGGSETVETTGTRIFQTKENISKWLYDNVKAIGTKKIFEICEKYKIINPFTK